MFSASISNLIWLNPIFSHLELLLIVIAILICNLRYAPFPDQNWQPTPSASVYQSLKSGWYGAEALWKVFWPFLPLVISIFVYIDFRIETLTFTIDSWRTVHGMLLLPFLWWLVSIWKCSRNTRHRLFCVGARTAALLFFVICVLRMYLSFATPELLFDCSLLMQKFGDC